MISVISENKILSNVVCTVFSLLDRCQPGPMKLVLLVIIGWLVTQKLNDPKDFSDFLFEVRGTIKVDKSQSQIFEKKY